MFSFAKNVAGNVTRNIFPFNKDLLVVLHWLAEREEETNLQFFSSEQCPRKSFA
jgi:hypothetical protein